MDTQEALLYFPFEGEKEDILDKWEELLFEHKQFFLTRAVVPKLFRSKLTKLEKQYNAFKVLGGAEIAPQEFQFEDKKFSDLPLEAFQQMFAYRGEYKQKVLQTKQYEDLFLVVENWIALELTYAKLWSYEYPDDLEKPVISKEPDPMLLMGALKQWNENLDKSFTLLKKDFNALPKSLKDEVKRLSLLLKLSS